MQNLRPIQSLLFLTLTIVSCKTSQPVLSESTAVNVEVHEPDTIDISVPADPIYLGLWRVSAISDFKIPDPELTGMTDEIKAKILSDLQMELRADSTYTITGFDGTNNGRYIFIGNEMRQTNAEEGSVDTFIFSDVRFEEMKCFFNNTEGASGNITFSRIE